MPKFLTKNIIRRKIKREKKRKYFIPRDLTKWKFTIKFGSMFKVSNVESTKTGFAPKSAKALAVDTNVNDGTITSSPGFKLHSNADISSACVQDVVSNT